MAKKKVGSQLRPIGNLPYGVISFSLEGLGALYVVDAQVLRIRNMATGEVLSEAEFTAFAELHPSLKPPAGETPGSVPS